MESTFMQIQIHDQRTYDITFVLEFYGIFFAYEFIGSTQVWGEDILNVMFRIWFTYVILRVIFILFFANSIT